MSLVGGVTGTDIPMSPIVNKGLIVPALLVLHVRGVWTRPVALKDGTETCSPHPT